MTINERMTRAGVLGKPYTIAQMLRWAECELDRRDNPPDPTGEGWRNERVWDEEGREHATA